MQYNFFIASSGASTHRASAACIKNNHDLFETNLQVVY